MKIEISEALWADAGRAITLADARTPQSVRQTAEQIDLAIGNALGQTTLAQLAQLSSMD